MMEGTLKEQNVEVKTLKRKHVWLFWALICAALVLEGVSVVLGLTGEQSLRFGLLDASGLMGILAFLLFLAAFWVMVRFLRCPNCRSLGRSVSVRLSRMRMDYCRNCGKPILFEDETDP